MLVDTFRFEDLFVISQVSYPCMVWPPRDIETNKISKSSFENIMLQIKKNLKMVHVVKNVVFQMDSNYWILSHMLTVCLILKILKIVDDFKFLLCHIRSKPFVHRSLIVLNTTITHDIFRSFWKISFVTKNDVHLYFNLYNGFSFRYHWII